jgi:hypothetical protein
MGKLQKKKLFESKWTLKNYSIFMIIKEKNRFDRWADER